MQTSKIKPGETYAYYRGGKLFRFHVTGIITEKTSRKTTSQIEGYVMEDTKDGVRSADFQVDPENLVGPYQEQAELVERKAQEDAKRQADEEEKIRLGNLDRLALYRFVGVGPPRKEDEYSQMFRVGYRGDVDIRDSGAKAIIKRIHELELQAMSPERQRAELLKGV